MIEKTKLPQAAFVAENATVRGHVTAGPGSSIYFGAVIRSESEETLIGPDTNIQDGVVMHEEVTVGAGCTIGHSAVIHGCTIGDNVLVGMGAVVLNGAKLGDNCIVGAGALVTGKMDAPAGSMILGSPAKVVRPLTEEEIAGNRESAQLYLQLARQVREG